MSFKFPLSWIIYNAATLQSLHCNTNPLILLIIAVECLEIEPGGVPVEFLGDYIFQITGILTAVGTAAKQIEFKKSDSNTTGWQGILFDNTPNGSQMTQCNISGSNNSGIRIINSLPQISSCSFTGNTATNGGGM